MRRVIAVILAMGSTVILFAALRSPAPAPVIPDAAVETVSAPACGVLRPRSLGSDAGSACGSAFPKGDPCSTADGGMVGAPGIGDSGLQCNILAYGAVPDASTNQSAAIQAAIDACDGGTVVIPPGTFQTGTVVLGSDMVFDVEDGGTVAGIIPADLDAALADYPTQSVGLNSNSPPCQRALIFANGAHNVTITGPGVINGQGNATIWGRRGGLADYQRPIAIWLANSKDLTLSGVNVMHSAMWSVVPMQDVGVLVVNTTIYSPDSPERDGLDFVDTSSVCVNNLTVTSEDDSLCLKSGALIGVEGVHVKNVTTIGVGDTRSAGNGLKLGTSSYGSFSDVCFENANVSNYEEAAMAVESVDGADVDNIWFNNINYTNVEAPFFVVFGHRYGLPEGGIKKHGSLQCVNFSNVTGTNVYKPWGSAISGTLIEDGGEDGGPLDLVIDGVSFNDIYGQVQGALSVIPPPTPPEYMGQYPRPSDFGQTPGYQFWTRHARTVIISNADASLSQKDTRPRIVQQLPP